MDQATKIERTFKSELEALINRYSKEKGSNTPDWILASYIETCLAAFDSAVVERDRWYGVCLVPGVCWIRA